MVNVYVLYNLVDYHMMLYGIQLQYENHTRFLFGLYGLFLMYNVLKTL